MKKRENKKIEVSGLTLDFDTINDTTNVVFNEDGSVETRSGFTEVIWPNDPRFVLPAGMTFSTFAGILRRMDENEREAGEFYRYYNPNPGGVPTSYSSLDEDGNTVKNYEFVPAPEPDPPDLVIGLATGTDEIAYSDGSGTGLYATFAACARGDALTLYIGVKGGKPPYRFYMPKGQTLYMGNGYGWSFLAGSEPIYDVTGDGVFADTAFVEVGTLTDTGTYIHAHLATFTSPNPIVLVIDARTDPADKKRYALREFHPYSFDMKKCLIVEATRPEGFDPYLDLGQLEVGVPYSKTLTALPGVESYRWSCTALPDGLSIDITTGVISGTPTGNSWFLGKVELQDYVDTADPMTPTTPYSIATWYDRVQLRATLPVAYPVFALANGSITWHWAEVYGGEMAAMSDLIMAVSPTLPPSPVLVSGDLTSYSVQFNLQVNIVYIIGGDIGDPLTGTPADYQFTTVTASGNLNSDGTIPGESLPDLSVYGRDDYHEVSVFAIWTLTSTDLPGWSGYGGINANRWMQYCDPVRILPTSIAPVSFDPNIPVDGRYNPMAPYFGENSGIQYPGFSAGITPATGNPADPYVTSTPGTTAIVGDAYTYTLTVNGDGRLVAGTVPSWASYDSNTLTVSGIPTSAGNNSFFFRLYRTDTPTEVTGQAWIVAASQPEFTSSGTTTGAKDTAYSYAPTYTGASATVVGTTIPAWATFDGTTLSGTPSTAGTYPVVLTLYNGLGEVADTDSFSIVVSVAPSAAWQPFTANNAPSPQSITFMMVSDANDFLMVDGSEVTGIDKDYSDIMAIVDTIEIVVSASSGAGYQGTKLRLKQVKGYGIGSFCLYGTRIDSEMEVEDELLYGQLTADSNDWQEFPFTTPQHHYKYRIEISGGFDDMLTCRLKITEVEIV